MPDRSSDLLIIPARYGSTRLPGKPLLKLAGRSVLERVLANANAAASTGGLKVIVATDHERIADHARALGAEVVMTDPALASGTERAHAAVEMQATPPKRIISLHGDAPFISSQIITKIAEVLRSTDVQVATPVYQLDWERLDRLRAHKRSAAFSGTTCVRDRDGKALWFSKAILPAMRNEDALRRDRMSPVWQHLGLYGYTRAALDWFISSSMGEYEKLEGLEQLRFLENDWPIMTVPVDPPSHSLSGIDTAEDLALAEEAVKELGDPFPLETA